MLDPRYDYGSIRRRLSRSKLATRVRNMWRYAELLPTDPRQAVTLGEGFTPLVKARSSSEILFKLEFSSPTGSFKDRGSSTLISKAVELKAKATAIDSSGNAAASLSAYRAKAGLPCYVFAPAYASPSKLLQSQSYGSRLFKVEGTRRDTYEVASAAYKRFGWYYCSFQTNPYASEGMKTIGYEICEQLRWKPPDWIIFPVGTGSGLIGCWKGLKEMLELGWISKMPHIGCIQPEGCGPISTAFKGSHPIVAVEKPKTVAEGLMIAKPLKGDLVLKALKETDGIADTVSDDRIVAAGVELAKTEGLFVEPSAAASYAGLLKLRAQGKVSRGERMVCILTGSGLKTPDAYSDHVVEATPIRPAVDELVKVLGC